MKLTTKQIKQIIKEELESLLSDFEKDMDSEPKGWSSILNDIKAMLEEGLIEDVASLLISEEWGKKILAKLINDDLYIDGKGKPLYKVLSYFADKMESEEAWELYELYHNALVNRVVDLKKHEIEIYDALQAAPSDEEDWIGWIDNDQATGRELLKINSFEPGDRHFEREANVIMKEMGVGRHSDLYHYYKK